MPNRVHHDQQLNAQSTRGDSFFFMCTHENFFTEFLISFKVNEI